MKIDSEFFLKALIGNGFTYYSGVPDSTTKELCNYIFKYADENKIANVSAPNEGIAIANATGYHLASGKVPVVYLQNSGLGNTLNPLTSLTHKSVYSIPILLIIGWRGAPGIKDEPQHFKMGKITIDLLNLLDIPFIELTSNSNINEVISSSIKMLKEKNAPVSILVKNDTFEKTQKVDLNSFNENRNVLNRHDVLKTILNNMSEETVFISTTGMISRELYSLKNEFEKKSFRFFYNVGAMGHVTAIALGISSIEKNKNICILDGDGSQLMHLGILGEVFTLKPKNIFHFILNNGVHESVGGQKTANSELQFHKLYESQNSYGINSSQVHTVDELEKAINSQKKIQSYKLIEVKIGKSSNRDLPRPTESFVDLKKMYFKV